MIDAEFFRAFEKAHAASRWAGYRHARTVEGEHMDTAPADSLVALAGCKRLFRHQFMDAATIEWIAANRPRLPIDGGAVPRVPGYARRLLALTAIPDTWFAQPRLIDSIHGLRHGMRTATYVALLAEDDGLDEQLSSSLIIAAALHDCRRAHDQDDTGHGARAAAWLETHTGPVADHFGVRGGIGREFRQATTAVCRQVIAFTTV